MTPGTETSPWPRPVRFTAIALVLIKLWLVAGQTMRAPGASSIDDRLFLNLTAHLLQGEWLGPYTEKTLAKGPFFSLFVAGVFLLGVPLFTAIHLLYAASCGVMVKALQPLRLHAAVTFGLFALLLFNPVTYDTAHHLQLLRQTIIPFLSLFIAAGLAGLAARHGESPRRQLPWAVLLGLSLSAFWITREESVWILPAVILPMTWLGWKTWQARAHAGRARLATLLLPLALWTAGPLTVSTLNLYHYGLFTTCEFKEPAFKAGYGALTRVTPAHWHPYIPVPRETCERLYAVSPAFAELRPFLEGRIGKGSVINSLELGFPLEAWEMGGGQFMWALRASVHAAGHAPDAATAMAFYERLANEVNAACDDGRLAAGPRHVTMLPPLVADYRPRIRDSLHRGFIFATTLDGLTVKSRPSRDSLELRALFADLTRARLSPAPEDIQLLIAQPIMDRIRVRLLGHVLAAYRLLIPWAACLAAIAWCTAAVLALRKRRLPLFLPLGIGLAGSALAVVVIASLVDATSFRAIHSGYLSGFYGFYLLVIGLAWPALREPSHRA